jgi:recombination protein RecR
MTQFLPKSLRNLIEEFSKLPGIGPKSAQRLAMHLLRSPGTKIEPLGKAILGLKEGILFCETCWNIADENPCSICSDLSRDRSKICVVEEVLDAAAIEKTGEYDGLYHVLHGVLSPVDRVGVEELKIGELIKRVRESFEDGSEEGDGSGSTGNSDSERAGTSRESGDGPAGKIGYGINEKIDASKSEVDENKSNVSKVRIKEIIMATNPSLEGEATALYIQKQLASFDVRITRIARGLPTGADIEYSDDLTLSRAMNGRGEF